MNNTSTLLDREYFSVTTSVLLDRNCVSIATVTFIRPDRHYLSISPLGREGNSQDSAMAVLLPSPTVSGFKPAGRAEAVLASTPLLLVQPPPVQT